jgi:hypothetical protein
MLDAVSLIVRGVKEVGLRPTWDAVAYQIRLLWYRLRFGRRTRALPASPAAYGHPGPVTGWHLDGQTLAVDCANGAYALRVLAPEVVRVRFRPSSRAERAPRTSYAVARADDTWPACAVEAAETADAVALTTSRLRCRVDRASGRLTFLDPQGRVVNEDADGAGWGRDGQVICHKRIQPDERFYGLGERTSGLDHRGGAFETWNSDPQTYEVGQVRSTSASRSSWGSTAAGSRGTASSSTTPSAAGSTSVLLIPRWPPSARVAGRSTTSSSMDPGWLAW